MDYSKILSKIISLIILFAIIFVFTSSTLAANLVKEQKIVVEKEYTVKSSDTLWSISKNYNIPLKHIKQYNNIKDNEIKKESKLKLPDFKTLYLVKIEKNDTLWSIAQKYNTTVKRLKKINKLAADTIYKDQHLLVIKDSSDNYYPEKSIPTQDEYFVNFKDKDWIIQTLTDLVPDKRQKEEVKQEITEQDNVSRYELAVMLESILHKLEEDKKTNNVDNDMSSAEIEKLEKLIIYLQNELDEMNVKIENINKETVEKEKDKDKEKLEENEKNIAKKDNKEDENVDIDNNETEESLEKVAKGEQNEEELKEKKELNDEDDNENNNEDIYTQIILKGLTKLEWEKLITESGSEERLSQIVYLNIDSYLTASQKMNFFFQVLYDYIYENESTEVVIGTKGDFYFNNYNKVLLNFAHKEPFNKNMGNKKTYFDLGWKLKNSVIDLNLITAHTKLLSDINSLNSVDIILKNNDLSFNANYQEQDNDFSSVEVGRTMIPAEDYLINYEEKLGFRVITPLTKMINFKGGYQRADQNQGPTIGLETKQSNWSLDVDYNYWDKKSVKDSTIWAKLNYNEDPLEILVELNYDIIENNAYSNLKTVGKIDLSEKMFLDLKYILKDVDTSTSVGFGYKF